MKRIAAVMMLALTLAACDDDNNGPTGPSNTGPLIFTAQLSSANEVPPVSNAEQGAGGTVTITFAVPRDSSGNVTGAGTATFAVQVQNFPANTPINLAHIHTGAAGVNGGVLVNTGLSAASPFLAANGSGNTTISNIAITQEVATQIAANPAGFYFNMHTSLNPGGAIRGQLTRTQ